MLQGLNGAQKPTHGILSRRRRAWQLLWRPSDLGPWPVAGLRAAGYQVYPAIRKVHKTTKPLTHKFAPGFKWRTETYSRHSFPSKACLATLMATSDLGPWPVAGLRAARYQVYPALQKVDKTAGPLTHKFAPGFKWRTETYLRRSFPPKVCLANFMTAIRLWTLACGWA